MDRHYKFINKESKDDFDIGLSLFDFNSVPEEEYLEDIILENHQTDAEHGTVMCVKKKPQTGQRIEKEMSPAQIDSLIEIEHCKLCILKEIKQGCRFSKQQLIKRIKQSTTSEFCEEVLKEVLSFCQKNKLIALKDSGDIWNRQNVLETILTCVECAAVKRTGLFHAEINNTDDQNKPQEYRFILVYNKEYRIEFQGKALVDDVTSNLFTCSCMVFRNDLQIEKISVTEHEALFLKVEKCINQSKSWHHFVADYERIVKKGIIPYLIDLTEYGTIEWEKEVYEEDEDDEDDYLVYMSSYSASYGEEYYTIEIEDEDERRYRDPNTEICLTAVVGDHLRIRIIDQMYEEIEELLCVINRGIITIKDVVVRTSGRFCIHRDHKLERMRARVNIIRNNEIHETMISVYYCLTCNVYYMSEEDYENLIAKGKPCCRIVTETAFRKIQSGIISGPWKEESLLMSYGYTVNKNDNLSPYERQQILSFVIQHDIIKKQSAIDHLEWCIKQHSGYQYQNARDKWNADLNYLRNVFDSVRVIQIGTIFRTNHNTY